MRCKSSIALTLVVLFVLGAVTAEAAVLRILVVETSDPAAYARAVEQGQKLLASKGSPATIRLYRGRFAGPETGAIKVLVQYPSLEALAKDDALMKSDAELKSWFAGLDRVRRVVSDGVYEELNP